MYYKDKEGKLVLVDYKTDFVENRDKSILVQKYENQIECYRKAIEQGTVTEINFDKIRFAHQQENQIKHCNYCGFTSTEADYEYCPKCGEKL